MAKYRLGHLVEAVQNKGTMTLDMQRLLEGATADYDDRGALIVSLSPGRSLVVGLHDYLVRRSDGELQACDRLGFEDLYEQVVA